MIVSVWELEFLEGVNKNGQTKQKHGLINMETVAYSPSKVSWEQEDRKAGRENSPSLKLDHPLSIFVLSFSANYPGSLNFGF